MDGREVEGFVEEKVNINVQVFCSFINLCSVFIDPKVLTGFSYLLGVLAQASFVPPSTLAQIDVLKQVLPNFQVAEVALLIAEHKLHIRLFVVHFFGPYGYRFDPCAPRGFDAGVALEDLVGNHFPEGVLVVVDRSHVERVLVLKRATFP